MKKLKSKLSVLTILFALSSCGGSGIKFDPDAHFFFKDENEEIYLMSESGIRIYEFEQWQEFAAMHIDKWKELLEILKQGEVKREIKKNYSYLPYYEQKKEIIKVINELSR